MYVAEFGMERGFSPIADNLIALRYERALDALWPILTVVKTRGSAHDRGIYHLTIGKGGARIGERISAPGAPPLAQKTEAPTRAKRRR